MAIFRKVPKEDFLCVDLMEISREFPGIAPGWQMLLTHGPLIFPFSYFSLVPSSQPLLSYKIKCDRSTAFILLKPGGEPGSFAPCGHCPVPTPSGLGQVPLPPSSELWLQLRLCTQITEIHLPLHI